MRVLAFILLAIFVCDAVGESQGTFDEQAVRRQLLELLTLRHHNAGETMSESEEEPMGGSAHGSHVESESEEGFVESESEEGFEEAPTVGSEEGTAQRRCENPCPMSVFGENGVDITDEFFKCVMDKGVFTEKLNRIFREKTGNNLFEEREINVIYYLRNDWTISRQLKLIFEIFINEIGAGRFMSGLDKNDLTTDQRNYIEEFTCQYSIIRDKIYQTIAMLK